MYKLPTTARNSLLKISLKYYKNEFDDHKSRWRRLDDKAQAMLTTSGAFTAAAFAFFTGYQNVSRASIDHAKCAVVFSVILLMLSALFSMAVLWVSKMQTPPTSKEIYELATERFEDDDESNSENYLSTFVNEQVSTWNKCIEQIIKTNESKGALLIISQICLTTSIATLGVAALLIG